MGQKGRRLPDKLRVWVEARQKYHLSHAHIQMARELGLNPKKFGSLANETQEPWKLPLPQFIEKLYLKRFGKAGPERVVSIEERVREEQRRTAEKRERKQANRRAASSGSILPG